MASVDSSGIPAGFFSTFSIADPNNPAPGNIVRSQKRNRRVFVCIPCHRRKLKCDKLLPCSRCAAAEIAHECSYMPPPSPVNRSKKRRGRKTTDGGRVAKDTAKPRPKVKRESSPGLLSSSSSSSPSSLSSSCSRSPSPSPSFGPSSPRSSTTRSRKTERAASSVSKATTTSRKTSYPATEDEDDDQEKCDKLDGQGNPSVNPLNGASHWTRIACEVRQRRSRLFAVLGFFLLFLGSFSHYSRFYPPLTPLSSLKTPSRTCSGQRPSGSNDTARSRASSACSPA